MKRFPVNNVKGLLGGLAKEATERFVFEDKYEVRDLPKEQCNRCISRDQRVNNTFQNSKINQRFVEQKIKTIDCEICQVNIWIMFRAVLRLLKAW